MSSAATETGLQELSDPEFFVRWARVRLRYATARTAEIRADYDAVLAEYRRRLGELPSLPARTPQASGHTPNGT